MKHTEDRYKFEQRKTEARISDLKRDIKANAKNPAPLLELGKLYLYHTTDHAEEGKKVLLKAARLNEGDGKPLEILAVYTAYHLEERIRATNLFKKAAGAYEKGGNPEKRNEMLNEAATIINDEGWSALEKWDFKKAKTKATKALDVYPDHIDARNILGNMHLKKMEFAQAESEYRTGFASGINSQHGEIKLPDVGYWGEIETRPYIRSIHGLGLSLLHQYKFEESLQLFETLLDLVPGDNLGVRFLMGDLYFYLNQTTEAANAYRKKGESNAFFGSALLQLSNGNKKEAEKLLKRSIEMETFTGCFLHFYLTRFRLWEKKQVHPRGKLPVEYLHRMAHTHTWNEMIDFIDDYRKQLQFDSAAAYIGTTGPLWVRTNGSFEFLERILFSANPEEQESRILLGAYGMIASEDKYRFGV